MSRCKNSGHIPSRWKRFNRKTKEVLKDLHDLLVHLVALILLMFGLLYVLEKVAESHGFFASPISCTDRQKDALKHAQQFK